MDLSTNWYFIVQKLRDGDLIILFPRVVLSYNSHIGSTYSAISGVGTGHLFASLPNSAGKLVLSRVFDPQVYSDRLQLRLCRKILPSKYLDQMVWKCKVYIMGFTTNISRFCRYGWY